MTQPQLTIQQALDLAQQHHSAGRLQEAGSIYQQILAVDAKNADALHLLGVVALQAGRMDDALRLINHAIAINPKNASYLCNLGLVMMAQNRVPESIGPFQQALALKSDIPEAHSNLGYALRIMGRFDEAIVECRKALAIRPNYLEAEMNLGVALHASRELDQAISVFQKIVSARPDFVEAHFNLASALNERGQIEPAIGHLRRAIAIQPRMLDAHNLLGILLRDRGQLDEAIAAFSNALSIDPNSPEAHNNLGHSLHTKGEFGQAMESYRRALAINPNFAGCWNNLGNSLRAVGGRMNEAIAAYRNAVALAPGIAEMHVDLGVGLQEIEQIDEAISEYEKALSLKPELATAHYNLSLALMLKGNLERGFSEYVWREKVKDLEGLFQAFAQPRWDGKPLRDDQRLLIHCEQGQGDTIQFVRYLPMIAQRVKHVIFACQPSLARLVQGIEGVEQVITHGQPLGNFDLQCPLLNLPHVFHTTLETIPSKVQYLKPDPQLVAQWRERIGNESRLKIGMAWAGKREQKNNRNRSIATHLLAPLAKVREARWFCLQKDQQPPFAMDSSSGFNFTDWTSELNDFSDTAALIENLDLLITVDTAVAHLAGAIAKPVWVMMAMAPDFRWMLGRNDSPWYTTMRLFRQQALGDWSAPIDEITKALRSL